jgi:lipopolysaccharide transport system ATP-binding protein
VETHLYDQNETCVFALTTESRPLQKGLHRAVFHIPAHLMNDGIYYANTLFVYAYSRHYFFHERANSFEVEEDREAFGYYGKWIGAVRPVFIKNDYLLLEPIGLVQEPI